MDEDYNSDGFLIFGFNSDLREHGHKLDKSVLFWPQFRIGTSSVSINITLYARFDGTLLLTNSLPRSMGSIKPVLLSHFMQNLKWSIVTDKFNLSATVSIIGDVFCGNLYSSPSPLRGSPCL